MFTEKEKSKYVLRIENLVRVIPRKVILRAEISHFLLEDILSINWKYVSLASTKKICEELECVGHKFSEPIIKLKGEK